MLKGVHRLGVIQMTYQPAHDGERMPGLKERQTNPRRDHHYLAVSKEDVKSCWCTDLIV